MLGSIVGCVYTFGFIMMTPQLFINYKLKSTAHMPWKTFMYKALNTFVDDLFAFIIKASAAPPGRPASSVTQCTGRGAIHKLALARRLVPNCVTVGAVRVFDSCGRSFASTRTP